jgi:hypothetical protein
MYDDKQHQPKGVGDDVALASLYLFARILAPNTTALCRFDALAVNHSSRRTGFSPFQFTTAHG